MSTMVDGLDKIVAEAADLHVIINIIVVLTLINRAQKLK